MEKDAALVERLLDAFGRRDADALAGMVADDFLFEPCPRKRPSVRLPWQRGMRSYLDDVAETWRQFDVRVGAVRRSTTTSSSPGGSTRVRANRASSPTIRSRSRGKSWTDAHVGEGVPERRSRAAGERGLTGPFRRR
jgi:ketosteroid isomerase-like protein